MVPHAAFFFSLTLIAIRLPLLPFPISLLSFPLSSDPPFFHLELTHNCDSDVATVGESAGVVSHTDVDSSLVEVDCIDQQSLHGVSDVGVIQNDNAIACKGYTHTPTPHTRTHISVYAGTAPTEQSGILMYIFAAEVELDWPTNQHHPYGQKVLLYKYLHKKKVLNVCIKISY